MMGIMEITVFPFLCLCMLFTNLIRLGGAGGRAGCVWGAGLKIFKQLLLVSLKRCELYTPVLEPFSICSKLYMCDMNG